MRMRIRQATFSPGKTLLISPHCYLSSSAGTHQMRCPTIEQRTGNLQAPFMSEAAGTRPCDHLASSSLQPQTIERFKLPNNLLDKRIIEIVPVGLLVRAFV